MYNRPLYSLFQPILWTHYLYSFFPLSQLHFLYLSPLPCLLAFPIWSYPSADDFLFCIIVLKHYTWANYVIRHFHLVPITSTLYSVYIKHSTVYSGYSVSPIVTIVRAVKFATNAYEMAVLSNIYGRNHQIFSLKLIRTYLKEIMVFCSSSSPMCYISDKISIFLLQKYVIPCRDKCRHFNILIFSYTQVKTSEQTV